MADYRKRLAERVRHERERQSLSRDALALRADVNSRTIKRIEEQKVEHPRAQTIRHLAEGLGLAPEVLAPPEELEEDQLNRIEGKLDELHGAALPERIDHLVLLVERAIARQAEVLAAVSSLSQDQKRPQSPRKRRADAGVGSES